MRTSFVLCTLTSWLAASSAWGGPPAMPLPSGPAVDAAAHAGFRSLPRWRADDPPLPECAGIPSALDQPFFDYQGLSGTYIGSLPAADGQALGLSLMVTTLGPGPWADGQYNGLFMMADGTSQWRYGRFRALAVNPALQPGIAFYSGTPETQDNGFDVLGVLKNPAGLITAMCLYSWKQEWPPTVFPRRPFTLRRLM